MTTTGLPRMDLRKSEGVLVVDEALLSLVVVVTASAPLMIAGIDLDQWS